MKPRSEGSGGRPRRAAGKRPGASHHGTRVPVSLLAAALRAQSDGVLVARYVSRTKELRILFLNDSLATMIGRTAAEMIGERISVLHADASDMDTLRNWFAWARPSEPLMGDGFLRRRDGSTFDAAWSFDPLFNARGRLTHVVAAYRDQTERRRMQEALVHAQRLDAVGRLAGGVAHDFNNLLTAMLGFCDLLLQRHAAGDPSFADIMQIKQNSNRAANLVRQLLAFSRKQPLQPKDLNITDALMEMSHLLTRLIGESIEFKLLHGRDLGVVRVDPGQFDQMIINLAVNARDAMPGGGTLTITTGSEVFDQPGIDKKIKPVVSITQHREQGDRDQQEVRRCFACNGNHTINQARFLKK